MDFSNKYILGFATALCLVAALAVSSLAVSLKPRIDANVKLDTQLNILRVAGLLEPGEKVDAATATAMFDEIETLRVSRDTGEVLEAMEFGSYDMFKASKDPSMSVAGVPQTEHGVKARQVQI